MIDPGIRGKTAMVTGANSPIGIGAGIARALARQGVHVAVVFQPKGPRVDGPLPDEPGPERYRAANGANGSEVVAELRALGVRAEAFVTDLTDAEAVRQILPRVEDTLGAVDILVNNQAHAAPDSFAAEGAPLTEEGIAAHVAVNVTAPALLTAALAARVRERGSGWGRVVNLSTDAAPRFGGMVSYGATKHALESLSRTAAEELGPDGITVNIVSPGTVQTGGITASMQRDALGATPLGRIAEVDDIADVVVFLVSDQARWLTGQILYAGGGRRMH